MHPLHRLGLAIDADINKSNGTYVMNDDGARDPYGELEVEFQRAEDEMRRYRMDLNRPPNFNMPMPDENAQEDEEDALPEELSEDEADSGSKHDGEGDGGDVADDEEATKGDNAAMELVRSLSEAPTELDDPEARVPVENPPAIRHSPSWDVEFISGPSAPPVPETPVQPSSKTATAPFPMSKTLSAKLEPSSKTVKVDSSALKSPEKSGIKPEKASTADPPPRKRPDPKPKCQPTPEQGAALGTPSKSKATGTSSTHLGEVVNKPVKSNKCKAADEGDQGAGRALSSKKLAMSSSKGPQSKPGDDEDIINLISDEDDQFVANYITRKSEGNMASIAFMDQKRKIQHLEGKLEDANTKIHDLEMEVFKLKQDAKLQERVDAELAKRVDAELARRDQQRQLAVPLVPAPTLAQRHQPPPLNPAAPHLNDPFDPNHPFNQPSPGDNMRFDMQHMH
ncbi:hypothetical protein FRC11_008427 [Ceratobasidium sp. 423]|nr:hypothetical protein FRC11_008427 [Ceratobasidium sp. 423]